MNLEYSKLLSETEKVCCEAASGDKICYSNLYASYQPFRSSCKIEDISLDNINLSKAMSALIEDLLHHEDSSETYSNSSETYSNSPVTHQNRCKDIPVRVCVKVAYLRKMCGRFEPCQDLEQWCAIPGNYLATRNGRVFIGSGQEKHIFHYPKSPLCNPFKVTKDTPLEQSLKLYEEHLRNNVPKEEVLKLLEYSAVGCFCNMENSCHVDIILKYLRELCAE